MSRSAGEGKDWIQLMLQCTLRKEDVMISLLKKMRQLTEKKKQKEGGIWKMKPRNVSPLVLENLTSDKKMMMEIRSDSKPVVDWVNGSAKLKTPNGTVVAAQNLMWKWWSRGVDLRRRVADWALHFFVNRIWNPQCRVTLVV